MGYLNRNLSFEGKNEYKKGGFQKRDLRQPITVYNEIVCCIFQIKLIKVKPSTYDAVDRKYFNFPVQLSVVAIIEKILFYLLLMTTNG